LTFHGAEGGTQISTSGVRNPLGDLLDELEKFFGKPCRAEMRKTLGEIGGPILERLGMAGILAVIGINISGFKWEIK
jgi:hypothetical protein